MSIFFKIYTETSNLPSIMSTTPIWPQQRVIYTRKWGEGIVLFNDIRGNCAYTLMQACTFSRKKLTPFFFSQGRLLQVKKKKTCRDFSQKILPRDRSLDFTGPIGLKVLGHLAHQNQPSFFIPRCRKPNKTCTQASVHTLII